MVPRTALLASILAEFVAERCWRPGSGTGSVQRRPHAVPVEPSRCAIVTTCVALVSATACTVLLAFACVYRFGLSLVSVPC
jgi:hypothetical protein